MKKIFLMLLMTVGVLSVVKANNLNITNVSLTGATSTTIQVQYNMFWDNSWRDGENWDAVWVFVKYSTNSGVSWSHAILNSTGHVAGTATPTPTVAPSQDLLGAFVYRSAASSGTYTITQQQLTWNFSANSLNQTQAAAARIQVFGIEMVYVPQGMFALGDGVNYTSTPSPSTNAFRRNVTLSAVYITDQLSDSIQDPASGLYFRLDGDNGIDLNCDGVISTWPTDIPDFPTGYKAFYCMKYEITQGQYCDFLNTLSYEMQTNRVFNSTNTVGANAYDGSTTSLPSHRYNIFVQTAGVSGSSPRVYTATRPDRANNWMNWADGCAYADWAGLRPMTDMEWEKAARGPKPPVQGEVVFGATISSSYYITSITSGSENGQETPISTSQYIYNPAYTTLSGGDNNSITTNTPIRVGITARATTSRLQAGASYWGIMGMTGNMGESVVFFGNLCGRSFTGLHGNGQLITSTSYSPGAADVNFWPGINANTSSSTASTAYTGTTGVTNAVGISYKEEGFYNSTFMTPISARNVMSTSSTYRTTRYQMQGFRAVKSNF